MLAKSIWEKANNLKIFNHLEDGGHDTRELSRNSDMLMANHVVPSNSFLDFLAKNQDFNKVSIKSLSYDEHKFAKIRCLYGRRVTLNLKKEDESADDPNGVFDKNVPSVVV